MREGCSEDHELLADKIKEIKLMRQSSVYCLFLRLIEKTTITAITNIGTIIVSNSGIGAVKADTVFEPKLPVYVHVTPESTDL